MSIGQDLRAYLVSKGVDVYQSAGPELSVHCFWCPDGDPRGKGRLYLNGDTWLYSCFRCLAKGNRKILLRHFGDEEQDDLTFLPGTDPGLRRKALHEATALAEDMLMNNPHVLNYLTDRGLSPQTISDARLGYVPTSWGLGGSLRKTNDFRDLRNAGILTDQGQEFFSGHITIPYLSHGDTVMLRGRSFVPDKPVVGAKYITTAGDSTRFYGSDGLNGARDVIIVEGEFDQMMLTQALRSSGDPALRATTVVGVAGVNSLPAGFASYFSDARRVYVGFDADDAGSRGAERIKTILGSKVRKVELPARMDWSDFLAPSESRGWRDVAELIREADAAGRTLYAPFDLARQWAKVDTTGGIKTGIEMLDKLIEPGIKPGQLMVPLAMTSVGKTAFLASLVDNMRFKPTLVVSLELTGAEFWDRLRRVRHFWSPLATEEQIAEEYAKLRVFDRRLSPGDLPRLAEEFAEDVGEPPQVVVVDYLGYAAKNWRGGSSYERVSNCVIDIKEDAKLIGCSLIAPHQVSRNAQRGQPLQASDARDAGTIEETADFLLGLFRPSQANAQAPDDAGVTLQVLKNRNGLTDRLIHLLFSNASLVLVEKHSAAGRVVETENRLIATGANYGRVRLHRQNAATVQPDLSGKYSPPRVVGRDA